MKRPLEYIAEGFVLGEVLALLTVGWMAGILAVVMVGVYCLWKQNGRSLIWWLLPILGTGNFVGKRGFKKRTKI